MASLRLPFALSLVLLALVALAACAPGEAEPAVARVGERAPRIVLEALDGGPVRLADQRGKVVLLNFWATWCTPCREEMPALQRLADGLAGQPFALWTVNLQEDAESIGSFAREVGISLPVLLDVDGDVTRRYGVRGLPATFLIDQQGVVRQQRLGPILEGDASRAWSAAWLEQQIRDLLAGSG